MKINIHVLIFVLIAIIAALNDIVIYIFNSQYWISLILISTILISLLIFFIKKQKIKIFNNFEKMDLLFLIPYLLIMSTLFLSCDQRLDTFNYHLYLQENPFIDKVNFDRLLSHSFLFPLGDRMAYIFRSILGYRFGMILSFYTMIILFFQVKKILTDIFPNLKYKKLITIFSGLVLLTATPNWRSTTFHIDNFSMVIFLEFILIFVKNENIFKNKAMLYYISLLSGISIGIKVINAVLVAVFVIVIVIRDIKEFLKNIKIKDVIICIFLVFLPFIVYAIDNYIQTGNPVFPYYNNIFKSEYYEISAGLDERFGMPNALYAFVWPILVTVEPLLGFDYDIFREPLWAIGYIMCIGNVCVFSFEHKQNKIKELSILGIILALAWAVFMLGYIRYALIIPILYYIIISSNIIKIINEFKYDNIKMIFDIVKLTFLFLLLLIIILFGIKTIIFRIYEAYIGRIDINNYSFEDDVYEIDGVWATVYFNSGMIDTIRNKTTPIYNLDITREINCDTSRFTQEVQNELFEELKNKRVFTVTSDVLYNQTIKYLEDVNYEIIDEKIYKNSKFQNINNNWYILEIKSIEN